MTDSSLEMVKPSVPRLPFAEAVLKDMDCVDGVNA